MVAAGAPGHHVQHLCRAVPDFLLAARRRVVDVVVAAVHRRDPLPRRAGEFQPRLLRQPPCLQGALASCDPAAICDQPARLLQPFLLPRPALDHAAQLFPRRPQAARRDAPQPAAAHAANVRLAQQHRRQDARPQPCARHTGQPHLRALRSLGGLRVVQLRPRAGLRRGWLAAYPRARARRRGRRTRLVALLVGALPCARPHRRRGRLGDAARRGPVRLPRGARLPSAPHCSLPPCLPASLPPCIPASLHPCIPLHRC